MRKIEGYIVPIITPFTEDNKVDYEGYARNMEYLISEGIDGICVQGSFGEGMIINAEERQEIYKLAVKVAAGRCTVIGGASACTTADAIQNARWAKEAGCDGILVVQPPYIQPSFDEMFDFFKDINDAVDIPILVYNNPSKSAAKNLTPAFCARLKTLKNVVAYKEASPNFYDLEENIRLNADEDFNIICGKEFWALPAMLLGAKGCFGLIPLILGNEAIKMVEYAKAGEWDKAAKVQLRVNIVRKAMNSITCTPPAGVKAMMNMLGRDGGHNRRPIQDPTPEDMAIMRKALIECGALKE